MVVWTLWFCQFFTTQAMNSWLPTIYKTQLHFTVREALQYSFLNYGLGIVAILAVAFLLDKIGRRALFACAMPLGSIPLFILAYLGVGNPALVITLATLSVFLHGACSAPLYVYTPELYPTRMRAFACGSAATARNIGASLSPALVGIVLGSFGIKSVFFMLGIAPLVAAFVVITFGIETKRRVLEEISP
jgi:putative MFS transporter